ncbi:MAG TPA: response regulator [Candidatus Krumholzibacteria bacterium]|nr:response regulator [Candidatus Krumholzibacteria bacterium]
MSKSILVVDDEMYIVNILDFTLATEGLRVITAANGEEALRQAIENPPDLVILDVMMPKIDGFEVCRALKAKDETKDVPVILLTAKDRDSDREKGREAGADLYVTKPFSPTRLLEDVRSLLQMPTVD